MKKPLCSSAKLGLLAALGGIVLLCLCLAVGSRLRYPNTLYSVDSYESTKSHLSSNPRVFFPTQEVLPSGDHIDFKVYEETQQKLNRSRDGYSIGILGTDWAYMITCSPASSPIHAGSVPDEIRADYLLSSVPVMRTEGIDFPQLKFVLYGYYYELSAWGNSLPEDAPDNLLVIADSILQQVE